MADIDKKIRELNTKYWIAKQNKRFDEAKRIADKITNLKNSRDDNSRADRSKAATAKQIKTHKKNRKLKGGTAKKYAPWGKNKRQVGGKQRLGLSSSFKNKVAQKYEYRWKGRGVNNGQYKSWIQKKSGATRFPMTGGGGIPHDTYKPYARVNAGHVGLREYTDETGKVRKTSSRLKVFGNNKASGGTMTHQQWLIHLQIAAHTIPVNAQHFRVLLAQRAHTIFLESFQKQGFNGKSWKSLTAERQRQRRRVHNYSSGTGGNGGGMKIPPTWPGHILADSGNLFNSIEQKEDGEKSIVGTTIPYAIYHDSGIGRLPQRQFMGHTAALEKFSAACLDKYMFHDVFVTVTT